MMNNTNEQFNRLAAEVKFGNQIHRDELVAMVCEVCNDFIKANEHNCPNKDTLNSVTSEIYFKLDNILEKYDVNQNFKSYLNCICHNTYIDLMRKDKKYNDTTASSYARDDDGSEIALIDKAVAEEDIENDYIRECSYRELRSILKGLDPKKREAIELHYFEDKSVKEIAKIMDATEASVNNWLKRGRDAIKKELGEYSITP